MAIETEKKYRITKKQANKIRKRLEAAGAVFAYERFEENYLHRGGLLDERRAVLRLRKIGDTTVLTYKESLHTAEHVKHKIEFETEVADVAEMENIIGVLGYKLAVVYEKRRLTWHMDDVEVVLDELPFGLYMEIEGTIKNIARAEKRLGVQHYKPEIRGYSRLTAKYGRSRGGVMEARFAKAKAAKR